MNYLTQLLLSRKKMTHGQGPRDDRPGSKPSGWRYHALPVSYTHLAGCVARKAMARPSGVARIQASVGSEPGSVSYTHLDVYKRQACGCPPGRR